MPSLPSPMPRRWPFPLTLVALLVLATALPFRTAAAAATAPRPNIILIMADDMGFSDIGCYGGEVRTPNLDRLAREGLRFTQFYNNAKCTTTRASLLSGMYPRNHGNNIPLTIPTIGEAMRAAGYQTALNGKWHLGSQPPQRPIDRGFDENYGLLDGCCNFFNPGLADPPYKGGKVRVFAHNGERVTDFPPGYFTTDAFTDHSLENIRRFVKNGKPFFLHLAYTAPHYPLHAPPEDIAKYRGQFKMGWEEMRRQRHARQTEMGLFATQLALSGLDSKAYAWATANQDYEDHRMAVYAAMIDRMDRNIGRLLATLKELGVEDNTLIMFLSDNGGCSEEPGGRDPQANLGAADSYLAVGPAWGWAQNSPFRRYKSWVNEGGISTPFIVRWPAGIKAGTTVGNLRASRSGSLSDAVGHIIDVLPTCLELAGAKYPAEFAGKPTLPVEGRSLLPVLAGQPREPHAQICWEWSGNCAIRAGRWKLVWDSLNQAKRWELFDLEADRTELHDLAASMPGKVAELRASYERWANHTGRAIPGDAPTAKKKKKAAE